MLTTLDAARTTLLSVNVNKVAVLRNSRGGANPSVLRAAQTVLLAGADGITVHPRPDLRHIHPQDCLDLRALLREPRFGGAELNIEGNPFAPANARYPGLLALIEQARPEQATLVPDGDAQITSDHGYAIAQNRERLSAVIAKIRALGARVSLFVDDDIAESELVLAKELGAERIEIYTGPFASGGEPSATTFNAAALVRCARTAALATRLGLGVNAGHDLSQANLATLLRAAPAILEVSIGHALIDEALYAGLAPTIAAYRAILQRV
jgi:pyridoxine 5-phosphate synthase